MTDAKLILNKLLPKIAQEQNFVNFDLKIEAITSGGANYTSTLHNVTISEGDRTIHLFAKVAAIGEIMRTQMPKIYKTETFAYTKLLKVYKQLEDEHQVPEEHRLVFPKLYGVNTTIFEETLVFEDLVVNGFQAYDRLKSIDWPYAKTVLTELAKMHALSFAYSEYCPVEFSQVLEDFKYDWGADGEKMKGFFDLAIARALEATWEENKDKLKRFFENMDHDEFMQYYLSTRRAVIGHGDFRPSNLMHRMRDVSSFC